MRPYVLLPLLSLVSFLPARANLGETVQQVVARYGHPVGYSEANGKSLFGTVAFSAGGFELVIFVLNNEEVGARISKLDKSAFSDAEMQTIMGSDTNGSTWRPVAGPDPSTLQWTRADEATMLYDKDKHLLICTSKAMADALESHQKQAVLSPH